MPIASGPLSCHPGRLPPSHRVVHLLAVFKLRACRRQHGAVRDGPREVALVAAVWVGWGNRRGERVSAASAGAAPLLPVPRQSPFTCAPPAGARRRRRTRSRWLTAAGSRLGGGGGSRGVGAGAERGPGGAFCLWRGRPQPGRGRTLDAWRRHGAAQERWWRRRRRLRPGARGASLCRAAGPGGCEAPRGGRCCVWRGGGAAGAPRGAGRRARRARRARRRARALAAQRGRGAGARRTGAPRGLVRGRAWVRGARRSEWRGWKPL
jgi:hypothetical protein